MASWTEYFDSSKAGVIRYMTDETNTATSIGIDNSYAHRINELERKLEELQAFVEAVSRENIECNIEELI